MIMMTGLICNMFLVVPLLLFNFICTAEETKLTFSPNNSSEHSTQLPYHEISLTVVNCTLTNSTSNQFANLITEPKAHITIGPTDHLYFQDENKWIHQKLYCNLMSDENSEPKKFCLTHFFNGYTIGQCLPASCSKETFLPELWNDYQELEDSPNVTYFHPIHPTECEQNTLNNQWYKNPAIVFATVILVLQAMLAVTATLYDFFLRDQSDPDDYLATHNLFKCWSVKKNFDKVFCLPKEQRTIKPIMGLQAVSMFWFLVGRSYVLAIPFMDNPDEFLSEITKPWYMQIVINYTLAADIFFLCGGMVVSYNFFTERREMMEEAADWRLQGNSYFDIFKDILTVLRNLCRHRFVRTWPTMFWIMMVVIGMKSMYPDHPLFAIIDPWDQCQTSFWINLLFLNTVFPTRCLRYTWYLANDFIYYIITTPLVLLAMYVRYLLGMCTAVVLIVLSLITLFLMNLFYNFPPFIFPSLQLEKFPETYYDVETQIYIRSFTHYAPYLIGAVFGYTLAQPRIDDPFINLMEAQSTKHIYKLSWFGSLVGIFWAIFGSYPAFSEFNVPPAYYMIYNTFSPFVFALSIAWVVHACFIGESPLLNKFLSCFVWQPIANMEYSCFMVHYLVINVVFYYLVDFPIIWNGSFTLFPYIFLQLILTILISVPVYFCISIPPSDMEKIYLESKPPPIQEYQAPALVGQWSYLTHGRDMAAAGVSTTMMPIVTGISWLKRKILSSGKVEYIVQFLCSCKGFTVVVSVTAIAIIVLLNVI